MSRRSCQICEENQHKYKCPSCEIKYCSVPCYKRHKEDCAPRERTTRDTAPVAELDQTAEREDGELSQSDTEFEDSEDRVTLESLQRLGQSEELLAILDNPHLRSMLTSLDSSNSPSTDIAAAMQIPIFTEFADKCLSIVEPQKAPVVLGKTEVKMDKT